MRHITQSTLLRLAAVLAGACLVSSLLYAGGPLALRGSGDPWLWPNGGQNIPYNPDMGDLGPLDNAAAVALLEASVARWADVPTSTASYVNAGPLPVDVDETNFFPYVFPSSPDGYSAVVFDADGALFDLLFGPGTGVLGFAGPEWVLPATGEILESVAFINGGAILDFFPEDELDAIIVHEMGHFTNLAHTVTNGQAGAFGDNFGPTPFDTFPYIVPFELVETMYPFILVGGGMDVPKPDDIAILSTLYPEPNFFTDYGTITGTILAPDGTTKLTGVNVIARNVADPYFDAVSAISSDFTDDFSQTNPFSGVYTLNGLTPGATYALYVDQIFAGGFSTPILFPLPGVEELYNGANESADPAVDDPSVYTGVPSVAGSPTSGINVIFNRLTPGPIPLGDDDFVELFMPFSFGFCGTDYESVFVNSNGSLTFGTGSRDFSESVTDMLAGPPRIAPYWDDLNPSTGGVVSFEQTADSFTVRWTEVPEFFATGANTFAVTLLRSSNRVLVSYGDMTANDGLAGFSCGGLVTNRTEPEFDLTALAGMVDETVNGRNLAALYELFNSSGPNDLANFSWAFSAPNQFKDLREPNNRLTQATRVKLPFDSGKDFSEIRPRGADIDFFRFRAEAGRTLIAETLPGNSMDTLIGLFNWETGELLDVDDDDGVGLLSRIVYPIEQGGLYAIAVTTFPDFGFTGAGNDDGRYILNLQAIEGILLDLSDDDTEEVPFVNFQFPYQGMTWSSVWVNSNGNLTFGSGDTDFSESIAEFLNDQPRIAPLWDDLNPSSGGQVTVSRTASSMTVTFTEVPEFFATGANTFAVTMNASGAVSIAYGATNGSDGLVGVTEGGGAADPGETDLSAAGVLPVVGTTYEDFNGPIFDEPVDLDGLTLVFMGM